MKEMYVDDFYVRKFLGDEYLGYSLEEEFKKIANMTDEEALKCLRDAQSVIAEFSRKTGKTLTNFMYCTVIDRAIRALEEKVNSPKVVYLCKFHHGDYECKHTSRIEDAKNFKEVQPGYYEETENEN